MTTMSYHHKDKQIAVDSRTSSGSLIDTDKAIKYYKVNNCLLFLSGALHDIDIFISEYPEIKSDINCSGFCVDNKIVYHVSVKSSQLKKSKTAFNDADGSGYAFALAAMDFGKNARDAIKYAMKRDVYTGGRIRLYDIEKEKFI